jgi:KTSC domain-containing protein
LLLRFQCPDAAMPSTAIRYFRYDAGKRELVVTFITGRRYAYEDVPPAVFDAFRSAFSKGVFFNREIRDRYAHREVTREHSG